MKSRHFCFTDNNPSEDAISHYLSYPSLSYCIVGQEVGAQGTPHLQGHLVYKNAHTLAQVIKHHPSHPHLEISKAPSESIEYCKKEGNWQESGTPPVTKSQQGKDEQARWKSIRLAAQEDRLDDIPEDIRFKNIRLIEHHRALYLRAQPLQDSPATHLWYAGPSGTGKSRKAREDHPVHFDKLLNKWWDGYTNQPTVIIDDFDKRHEMLVPFLKRWADRYPFSAEVKNNVIKIRPDLIIVTSNWLPSQIWSDPNDLEPIERRFKVVRFGDYNEEVRAFRF